MKRFDLANEVAKQLITISAAIITLVVAFYEKFFSHNIVTFLFVLAALVLFILSVAAGVLSIGGLVLLAEEQENKDFRAGEDTRVRVPAEFVALGGTPAETYTKLQQVLFGFGLLLFIVVAIANYAVFSDAPPSTQTAASGSQQKTAQVKRPVVWVQLRPDEAGVNNQLLARAIVRPGDDCPPARIYDNGWFGTPATMQVRWSGNDPDFPVKMCELTYSGSHFARIGDAQFDPRPRNPKRILVIGDTGCRITHYEAQPCNRAADWPFAAITAAAKTQRPDLIIHLGDYHYREKPCAGRAGCADSPYGDNWAVWQAEFFDPAAGLLTSAPWVLMRGNHENCARAGAGWMLLLAPQPSNPAALDCADDTPPYELHFDHLALAVFDTANAEDAYQRMKRANTYRDQIRKFAPRLRRPAGATNDEFWLLLHQPLWSSYGSTTETDLFPTLKNVISAAAPPGVSANLIEQLRAQIGRPIDTFRQWFENKIEDTPRPDVSLVLSGDTHLFQLFRPQDAKMPNQIVAGMSGDTLENNDTYQKLIAGSPADVNLFGVAGKLWTRHGFGFLLLIEEDRAWMAHYYDVSGNRRLKCMLKRMPAETAQNVCEPAT
jgi:hypothetical protein